MDNEIKPPVELLPPEILAAIFVAARPRRRSRYKIPFEVVVSHVSAHWRGVAFDTASLWTNIDIYSIRSEAWINSYLERSSTRQLDVRLDIWGSDKETNGDQASIYKPIIDVIASHIHRWRSLLLFTYHERTAQIILSCLSGLTAPVLQRVRVVADELVIAFSGQSLTLPFFDGGRAPQLTSVEIDGVHNLPVLASLTTLQLHITDTPLSMTYSQLCALAAASPSLTTLSIRGPLDIVDWPIHGSRDLTMDALRSVLFSNHSVFAGRFLLAVSAPGLQSLWLDCPHYENIALFRDPLLPFIQNKFPALRYLTLQSYDFYATSLFAQVFPGVTHLHLAYCNIFHTRYLKEALISHNKWSKLDTVAIRTTRDVYVSVLAAAFGEITASRSRAGIPIKKLLLDGDVFSFFIEQDRLCGDTEVEELSPTNYRDPLWIVAHQDTGDRL